MKGKRIIRKQTSDEFVISKVQFCPETEELTLSTRRAGACDQLWGSIYAQSTVFTDGHKPIPCDVPDDEPKQTTLRVYVDLRDVNKLLNFVEDMHPGYLPENFSTTFQSLMDKSNSWQATYFAKLNVNENPVSSQSDTSNTIQLTNSALKIY